MDNYIKSIIVKRMKENASEIHMGGEYPWIIQNFIVDDNLQFLINQKKEVEKIIVAINDHILKIYGLYQIRLFIVGEELKYIDMFAVPCQESKTVAVFVPAFYASVPRYKCIDCIKNKYDYNIQEMEQRKEINRLFRTLNLVRIMNNTAKNYIMENEVYNKNAVLLHYLLTALETCGNHIDVVNRKTQLIRGEYRQSQRIDGGLEYKITGSGETFSLFENKKPIQIACITGDTFFIIIRIITGGGFKDEYVSLDTYKQYKDKDVVLYSKPIKILRHAYMRTIDPFGDIKSYIDETNSGLFVQHLLDKIRFEMYRDGTGKHIIKIDEYISVI